VTRFLWPGERGREEERSIVRGVGIVRVRKRILEEETDIIRGEAYTGKACGDKY